MSTIKSLIHGQNVVFNGGDMLGSILTKGEEYTLYKHQSGHFTIGQSGPIVSTQMIETNFTEAEDVRLAKLNESILGDFGLSLLD